MRINEKTIFHTKNFRHLLFYWAALIFVFPSISQATHKNEKVGEAIEANMGDFHIDRGKLGIGGLGEHVDKLVKHVLLPHCLGKHAQELGIEPAKGVLLYGPPGTGKSEIAKNLGELIPNSCVHKISGCKHDSKFCGSPEGIINLFNYAKEKEYKHHVYIFDEIDALGYRRTYNEYNRQEDMTLTQLLTEIDGIDSPPNITVVGTTNNKEVLDMALTRGGRFEIEIEIPLPNEQERTLFLEFFLAEFRKKGVVVNVDYGQLAKELVGFSAADIKASVKIAGQNSFYKSCCDKGPCHITEENLLAASKELLKPSSETSHLWHGGYGYHRHYKKKRSYNYAEESDNYTKLKHHKLSEPLLNFSSEGVRSQNLSLSR